MFKSRLCIVLAVALEVKIAFIDKNDESFFPTLD